MRIGIGNPSLLSFTVASRILAIAKKNLARDRFLQPVAFLQVAGGKRLMLGLEFPKEEKSQWSFAFGRSLKEKGIIVTEALMVFESWFVEAQKAPAALTVAPSQHPLRMEAINMMGRDAAKSRLTFVVLPFRKEERAVVFDKVVVESYAVAPDGAMSFSGLIDDFFAGNGGL